MRGLLGAALLAAGLGVLAGCAGTGASSSALGPQSASVAATEFERVKGSPVELRMFLQAFPKGGDLHNHLSGAIYAEDFIDWGLADGVCFDLESLSAVGPPCDARSGRPTLAAALSDGLISRDALIDAWSMRNFVPGHTAASGHEQFFRSFFRFDEAGRDGDMLAEAVWHAAEQEVGYLELMLSPEMGSARALARQIGPQPDFDALYEALLAAGIEELVPRGSARLDRMEATLADRFGCPQSAAPACEVEVRYLAQVIRTFPPEQVYAQSLLAYLLIEADPRIVGLNLVAPEDDHVTLTTYETQMRQLGQLAALRGQAPVALHAGELKLGLVHPRHLRSHMRQAIEVAGATRIGHGVSIAHERDAERLLMQMAEDRIAVEINLTSNAQILEVEGAEHPFETYRAYGVPLTLSTDDEGLSRGDLTHEYRRAVETYDLSYADLVALSRNAVLHAFVEGESLWADPVAFTPVEACAAVPLGGAATDAACGAFLEGNHKARLQWRLEARFADFEADRAALRRARGL
ncbi:adenosine deaminase family protein [Aquibaculum sediminis]|uniref:adenosine deaminase family protein n=1 Tax=Aquibaculum sediminis TaxID=3231907 RepID=UPI0034527020